MGRQRKIAHHQKGKGITPELNWPDNCSFIPKIGQIMSNTDLAQSVMERIDVLAQISEEQDLLTRTFGSLAMRRANHLVGGWMREAGMSVSEDAIGNLTGRYSGRNDRAKTFLLGSHLDTVRHAGKFDGALGVLAAIACVQQL